MIVNSRTLKSQLQSEGIEFHSDTDTEVIPQMIAKNLRLGLPLKTAISETISRLRGTFAMGIMSETHPHTLFALRRGSPLVLGIGAEEFFFASDIPAILPYSQEYIFLQDGQICTLTMEGIELECLETKKPEPLKERIVKVDWSPAVAE